ncbi:polyadenylate-binding protein-interacting protein 4-like isoform X1 [Raphanus sativus]|uniref:Polyadenylate-binding protein-interacting protein 4-like isoform X1 n=1 Tax=Raphanus sativus TaxID=3726 RepID=A0A9W3BT28_RAPSA|nr:polyadenylate-binding protein-interacting protein 4-like isoform X1 [Raphanus sativus]XP_056842383.1 polyadenylate-binding protein-interacting protein 4-like isoform X1 [Raphanus sativus]
MDEEDGSLKRHSRESLVYLTKCMVGHLVEAHLTNGSVYSGIFHAAHLEKDFGIILKMASLIKDGTLGGHESGSVVVRKPPMKIFYIPSDELVQVVAKSEKSVELLTDSSISKSCRADQRRELNPWVPDGEAPEGLDNVFDKPSKSGGWDQFKANKELFGVKSTLKVDMYTTTFDKGSWTRELEEKALRIAGEIEDEHTGDLHVAEERGLQTNEKFDTDEEAKYSAECPVDGFDEEGDKLLDTCNDQTFVVSSTSSVQNPASSCGQKPSSSSGKGYGGGSQSCSISDDHAGNLPSEQRSKDFAVQGSSTSESQLGERRNSNDPEAAHSNRTPEESVSGYGHGDIKEGANLGGGGGTSASKTVAEEESQVSQVSGKTKSESSFGQSASTRSSERGPAPSTSTSPGLSRSSSSSSLPSSEKSILNPDAKEFKPSQPPAPVRPQSPIAGGSFYYAAPPVQQMPRIPAGYGLQIIGSDQGFKPSRPPAPVRPQSPIAGGSFYYAAPPAPVQQMPLMPLMPAGYGLQIQPQYPEQQQLLRYPGHEYPETYYPPKAPPQYKQWQQMMMQGQQPRPPPPPYHQPGNPHNQG